MNVTVDIKNKAKLVRPKRYIPLPVFSFICGP